MRLRIINSCEIYHNVIIIVIIAIGGGIQRLFICSVTKCIIVAVITIVNIVRHFTSLLMSDE